MNSDPELTFYNTPALTGEELERHKLQAGRLNKRVLTFFRCRSYENFIPFEVYKGLGINSCIKSSVQRSITDLTEMQYLEKLDGELRPDGTRKPKVQRPGEWKTPCYAWRLI